MRYRVAAAVVMLTLALVSNRPAEAADAGAAVLSLDRAVEIASRTSPARESAALAIRSAEAGRTVAGLRPNPTVGVAVENFAGTDSYRRLDSAEATASAEFPIELGRKRSARLAVAEGQLSQARVDAAIADADLRLAVAEAYIAAVAAERRVVTAELQLQVAEQATRAAHLRVGNHDRAAADNVAAIDDRRADLLHINAEADLQKYAALAATARANLGRLLGRPLDEPLDVAWFHRIDPAGPVRPVVVDDTLALVAARSSSRTAAAQIALARSQQVPDLALNLGARRFSQSRDTAAVFGLSLPLPLLTNGRAAVAQATADRDRADADMRLARLQAEQALADAQVEVANAAITAGTANGPAYAVAADSARLARIGYRQGKLDQIALLDAERSFTETRMGTIDALAAYHQAKAKLERLTTQAPERY